MHVCQGTDKRKTDVDQTGVDQNNQSSKAYKGSEPTSNTRGGGHSGDIKAS